MNANSLIDFDVKHIWHPASQMKDYETFPPLLIKRAKGSYLYDENDRPILDIVSSWWCNLLGHCHEEISAALSAQSRKLEHVIFANFTHEEVIDYTRMLMEVVPNGLTHFNYADNGSSSVEMALKIAFQYQMQSGHQNKMRFACLENSYHGETIGALAVGSMDLYSRIYKPMLMETLRLKVPDVYYKGESDVEKCIIYAREFFQKYGESLCALIVEPLLQGAGGMKIYPPEFLKALSELCHEYGVLLIADEIATGFGRTGKFFACNHAMITPDIMCLSKAITGGYMPMSVVCTTDRVYDVFLADYKEGRAFMHSHTYAANPLGVACAKAVLTILKRDDILKKAHKTASWLHEEFSRRLGSLDNVGSTRHIGLINALDLYDDKSTLKPFLSDRRVGFEIYKEALKEGLLLRPIGDTLYFNPPLNISREELTCALEIAEHAIKHVCGA
jgi:adenosylmethionine-8-amino-7-oxononanoate aminotransferase